MIRHAFALRRKVTVATLNCSAQTEASHVVAKIAQCCALFSSPEGRVYRPRDGERLVLYLKDLNLPKPDARDARVEIRRGRVPRTTRPAKRDATALEGRDARRYDTCMLIAFLQQLVTFGGFYDAQLEFLRIESVQICVANQSLIWVNTKNL